MDEGVPGKETNGKSWRAHREIKGYAGSDKYRVAADERKCAAGSGAADESDNAACPADGAEQYDSAGRSANGAAAKADRTSVFAGYVNRLYETEEPLLEPDCAVYSNQRAGI